MYAYGSSCPFPLLLLNDKIEKAGLEDDSLYVRGMIL